MHISLAVALRETQAMSDIYQQRLLIQAQAIADLQTEVAALRAQLDASLPAAEPAPELHAA